MKQYTIIGLNQIGVSLGMALAHMKDKIICVGHDRETKVANRIERLKIFYQIVYNLRGAVEKADAVFICVPFDEVRETFEAIKDLLKPGAIIVDMSILKKPAGEWAEELLPEENPYIGIYPTINPEYETLPKLEPESARPDLFKGRILFLASGGKTSQEALQFGVELSEDLDCKWIFIDREEFDGSLMAFEFIGQILSAAMLGMIRNQPGNQEGQKIAGGTFTALGSVINNIDDRELLGKSWGVNRELLNQYLDMIMAEIIRIKELLDPERAKELEGYLQQSRQFFMDWEGHHQVGKWDKFSDKPVTSPGKVLGRLVEFGMFKDKNKPK